MEEDELLEEYGPVVISGSLTTQQLMLDNRAYAFSTCLELDRADRNPR